MKLLAAAAVLAVALWLGEAILGRCSRRCRAFDPKRCWLALAVIGMIAYVGAITLLFDRKWFSAFRGRPAPDPVPPTAAA